MDDQFEEENQSRNFLDYAKDVTTSLIENKSIVIVILFGLITLALTFGIYFFYGGFSLKASGANSDWGAFGSYFGGVAGPILTFVSVVLIAYTLYEQRRQAYFIHREAIKQDISSALRGLQLDINALLGKSVKLNNTQHVELLDFVYGSATHPDPKNKSYTALNDKLLRLTANYCEIIRAYEEDVDCDLVYRSHYRLARELLSYFKKASRVSAFGGIALDFCEILLDGEEEKVEKAKKIKFVVDKINEDEEVFNAIRIWIDSLDKNSA